MLANLSVDFLAGGVNDYKYLGLVTNNFIRDKSRLINSHQYSHSYHIFSLLYLSRLLLVYFA